MIINDYIVGELVKNGIDTVFGYQGGNITYFVDSIGEHDDIKYVQTYNEQGAAFAANAYSQVTQNFGVAIASSGPGAINMINGVANAFYDSIPCLFITGNVNTKGMRKEECFRQNSFQEADIISMVRPIVKYAKQVNHEDSIEDILDEAIKSMMSGRKGPVLIDLPHDIQRQKIEALKDSGKKATAYTNDVKLLNVCIELLNDSKNPVLLVGGGGREGISREYIYEFAHGLNMPVVSSLCGKDVFPNDDVLFVGMIGAFGNETANEMIINSDLILVLGSRLDERQLFDAKGKNLFSGKKIIHVDIDADELRRTGIDKVNVNSDVATFLEYFLNNSNQMSNFKTNLVKSYRDLKSSKYSFVDEICEAIGDLQVVTGDVGINQMIVAENLTVRKCMKYLNSGGLGSMGYSIAASIGASYGLKKCKVVAFTGDGGLMMNLQEIQTIVRDKLPITIVVLNNKKLEMISRYQEAVFEKRYYGSVWGYEVPSIMKLSQGFGIDYYKWPCDIKDDNRPKVIEIEID